MRSMTSTDLALQATFSELLRRWRRSHFLDQASFGQLLTPSVHASTVSCWENGSRQPSLRCLKQIVAITGIPVHLALGFEEGRP